MQITYIRVFFLPKINFKLEFFEWYKIYKRVTVKSKPLPALVPSHPVTVPMHNQYYSLCICPEIPRINKQSCICSSPLLTQMVTNLLFSFKGISWRYFHISVYRAASFFFFVNWGKIDTEHYIALRCTTNNSIFVYTTSLFLITASIV